MNFFNKTARLVDLNGSIDKANDYRSKVDAAVWQTKTAQRYAIFY